MCGICGFTRTGTREDLERMMAALVHRGPDDSGLFITEGLALGHRRLSILDPACGQQPMTDPQSTATIIYNGEIYNHWQIRLELERLGHVFKTAHSDTETVLRAFLQWGPDCFIKFNGMFACAIYTGHKLWLARDRFGEKPLFYIHNKYGFAFASETGSLKLWPGFEADFDRPDMQRFFAWNYLPAGRSIWKKCKSLRPGSWLRLDLRDGSITSKQYWKFSLQPDPALRDEAELAEELRRLLVQAVQRRFLSDVPVGIFLSGGIDSSAILAAACQTMDPAQIRTFTIGFQEKSFDESAKAKAVADFLHVPNEIEYLTADALQESIGTILSQMSEPFGDASLIPSARLAGFAARHVKVALSGDGGDELFGGYDPLDAIGPAALCNRLIPAFILDVLRKTLAVIPASDANMSLEFKIKRFLRGLGFPAELRIPLWMSGLTPAEIRSFFEKPLSDAELYEDAIALQQAHPGASPIEQAFIFFTCLYLPDDILVKSDRASMMHSLEARAVFLDNDLAEFCARLPVHFKYRRGERKYLLKKALSAWLPPHILAQPKKGFGIPLNRWLRALAAPDVSIPGLKPGVLAFCEKLHKKRKGDFRYFLWDVQAFAHLPHKLLL